MDPSSKLMRGLFGPDPLAHFVRALNLPTNLEKFDIIERKWKLLTWKFWYL